MRSENFPYEVEENGEESVPIDPSMETRITGRSALPIDDSITFYLCREIFQIGAKYISVERWRKDCFLF